MTLTGSTTSLDLSPSTLTPRTEIASYFDLATPRTLNTEIYIEQHKKQRPKSCGGEILLQERKDQIHFCKEQLRLTFSDDVWAEGTQTPSPDNNHRTNIIKPSRTKQSHHARALSSREENTRRRLVNQKLYGSFTQHKIRKSRSADELETENKFAVSPIKEQETVNFDSKLQIKPMFNKKIAYKDSIILADRMNAASEKKKKRMILMKALAKDCVHSQELIKKLKERSKSFVEP